MLKSKSLYYLFLIPLFSTVKHSKAQINMAPGVLDSKFISERHHVYANLIDIGSEVWNDIIDKYKGDSLVFEPGQDTLFGRRNHSLFYPARFSIPYLYLFHEDDHWAVRTYKTIDIENSMEGIFGQKGPVRHKYFRESDRSIRTDTIYNEMGYSIFIEAVQKALKEDWLTAYTSVYYDVILDENYHHDTIATDSIASLLSNANKLIVKEDYYYDKQAGVTGSHIVALGFFHNTDTLMWSYFPEASYIMRSNFLFYDKDINRQRNTSHDEVLRNHWYDIEKLEFQTLRINNYDYVLRKHNNSRMAYFTELHALLQVALMKEYIFANYINYSGNVEMLVHNGYKMKTSLQSGQIQGNCTFIDENGSVVVEAEFKNGIPHGKYFTYWPGGKVKEQGQFEIGLKEGIWLNFHADGSRMGKRNYERGWMHGEQKLWYPNGNTYMIFNYNDFMLNGPFRRFKETGDLMESGYFTDNYPDGKWHINLSIPDPYVALILNNRQLDWKYPPDAFADGVLSYDIELEVGPKEKNCPTPIFECVSVVSMSVVE